MVGNEILQKKAAEEHTHEKKTDEERLTRDCIKCTNQYDNTCTLIIRSISFSFRWVFLFVPFALKINNRQPDERQILRHEIDEHSHTYTNRNTHIRARNGYNIWFGTPSSAIRALEKFSIAEFCVVVGFFPLFVRHRDSGVTQVHALKSPNYRW